MGGAPPLYEQTLPAHTNSAGCERSLRPVQRLRGHARLEPGARLSTRGSAKAASTLHEVGA